MCASFFVLTKYYNEFSLMSICLWYFCYYFPLIIVFIVHFNCSNQ